MRRMHRALVASLCLCAAVLASARAQAVGTRQFVLDSLESLEGGDLTGVSVSSDGRVQAGFTLGAVAVAEASAVWAALLLDDGAVLLGTGNEGKIYRVAGGKVSVAAETGAMAVSALARAWNGDVVAGTFPDGKLYRFPAARDGGGKLAEWVTLSGTEDVWALAYDAKQKALFAATGPEGKLYRLTEQGKVEEHFDSEEAHLVSLALGPNGSVYAGSNGKALLYRLTGPGRAEVVYDFDADDVRAIAVAPPEQGGAVYAIANTYKDGSKGLPKRGAATAATSPATAETTGEAKPGKGQLWRFAPSGTAERMMVEDDAHFVSLALDERGLPHAGTGAEGRVYAADEGHVVRLVADTAERQVGAMVLAGRARFVATSDPVVLHPITGTGGPDAVWTSKVLDAGIRAHFGLLEWRADGQLELQTRSGNTEKPDPTWSAWSQALRANGKVASPAARYVQIRARWAVEPAAVLHELRLSFVTDNARALVTSIQTGEESEDKGGSSVPASGGSLEEPSAKLKIKWKVENPDSDELRYRLFYRALGEASWLSVLDPNEVLKKTEYTWDTTGLPEGEYRIRVDASDELANPPDRVTRHSLESRSVLVDNTPPVLQGLELRGNKLKGEARDGLGPIARIEIGLAGSSTWLPLFPTDGVLDEPVEPFEADVAAVLPPGRQALVVRAYDKAGNGVSRTVARK
ncbi:MAG: hypothetical protein HY744_10975 [Deltaproteobacteria bacterium]|nr:hypothetical protein [Deltaproteobacteria bacterium]